MTERFFAEPLPTENSWRVRDRWDGQNVAFRVSEEDAHRIAAEKNAAEAVLQKETRE